MNIIFLGCTKFSEAIFEELALNKNINIQALFSIPKEYHTSYSEAPMINTNYADFGQIAGSRGIPVFWVNGKKGEKLTDYKTVIADLNPDVILVMGWYYMIPATIRDLAKYGAWGIHASLLPAYAGCAPLVWAMIEGQKKTGVTLFKLGDGVDDGDIIEQEEFEIDDTDSIKEVYDKATEKSVGIIRKVFATNYNIKFMPQVIGERKVYPPRSPKDGEIDWSWEPVKIKNFIRAQSRPYPGAWTMKGDKKVIIWDADIVAQGTGRRAQGEYNHAFNDNP